MPEAILEPVPYALQGHRPLCYVHIPKTAGTTFSGIIEHIYGSGEICPDHFTDQLRRIPDETLNEFYYIGAHMNGSIEDRLNRAPYFLTFLRDPVERLLSVHGFTRNCPTRHWPHDLPVEQFFDDPRFYWLTRNSQTNYLGTKGPLPGQTRESRLQFDYTAATHETYDRARKFLDRCVFVGLQECFEESMHLLCLRMGWPPIESFERRNPTAQRNRASELSQDFLEQIKEANKFDFDLHEHAKAIFKKQVEDSGAREASELPAIVERKYRLVFREQFPPRPEYHYDMKHALPGSGWHAAEIHEIHGNFRWTSDRARVDLPLAASKGMRLVVHVIGAMSEESLATLRFSLNGQPIEMTSRPGSSDSAIYETKLDSSVIELNYPTKLEIFVDHTVTPAEQAMGEDTRKLGVAICSIKVIPA